MFTPISAKVLS